MHRPYGMLISRCNSARSLLTEAVVHLSRYGFARPIRKGWRYPGPVKATGDEWKRKREGGRTLSALQRQMRIFMQLTLERLDAIALQKHLDHMAREEGEAACART